MSLQAENMRTQTHRETTVRRHGEDGRLHAKERGLRPRGQMKKGGDSTPGPGTATLGVTEGGKGEGGIRRVMDSG